MSNEQPSRPPKRSGSGASPMGSTLAIVIAIAAVVVGFLILKNIRSDDGGTAATTLPATTSIDPSTVTTFPPLPTEPEVHGVHSDDHRGQGARGQLVASEQGRRDPQHRARRQPVHDG